MGQLWFYGRLGSRSGPYSAVQLRDLALAGEILVTDTVWKDGIELGVLADRVKNLFSVPALAPLIEKIIAPLIPTGVEQPRVAEITAPESAPVASSEPGVAEAAMESSQIPAEQPASPPCAPKKLVRKMRALAIRGAKITSQDGVSMQFRKICTTCGHEDAARTTMTIRVGKTKVVFYCRKCRKAREVEIQGLN
jgi:hypothetical protein